MKTILICLHALEQLRLPFLLLSNAYFAFKVDRSPVSHALNTSAFGVARLKAHSGESLRPYDLVWPHVSTHENEAIQPSYILCNQARRSEVRTPEGTCIYSRLL